MEQRTLGQNSLDKELQARPVCDLGQSQAPGCLVHTARLLQSKEWNQDTDLFGTKARPARERSLTRLRATCLQQHDYLMLPWPVQLADVCMP